MKTKLAKKFINLLLIAAALIFMSACKPASERLYSEAYSEIEKNHFRIAVDYLERGAGVDKNNSTKYKHLLEAAQIARFEIQDYERAIRIYREIILKSDDVDQRVYSQKSIAEIYFENLQSYEKALKELQILEPLIKDEDEREKIKLKIAQTQYLTGNNQQAIEEIEISLKTAKTETLNLLKLKAQVLVAQKKFKEAIACYQEILKRDEKYFANENLFIATSVVYEENEEYEEALEYMSKYEKQIKDKAYYELRYKRLRERLINKPLFKGRRK